MSPLQLVLLVDVLVDVLTSSKQGSRPIACQSPIRTDPTRPNINATPNTFLLSTLKILTASLCRDIIEDKENELGDQTE